MSGNSDFCIIEKHECVSNCGELHVLHIFAHLGLPETYYMETRDQIDEVAEIYDNKK